MHFATRSLAAVFALTATFAMAADATDPTVKARQELMDMISAHTKVLGDMATEKAPFDAAKATEAKAALAAAAAQIPARFEANVDDPKSQVVPAIWTNFDDFTAKGKALEDAAIAIDVSSVDTMKAGLGAIGGACGACHKAYQAKR